MGKSQTMRWREREPSAGTGPQISLDSKIDATTGGGKKEM